MTVAKTILRAGLMTGTLALALPAGTALAQTKSGAQTDRSSADRATASQTGGDRSQMEPGELSLGRQYGSPAGNQYVTPADPAAMARHGDPTRKPGLHVNPDLLGTGSSGIALPQGTSQDAPQGTGASSSPK